MAVDTSENLAVSAFVAVVLLDGILFEGLAAGIASEEHHFLVSLDHFHGLATFIHMHAFQFHVLITSAAV